MERFIGTTDMLHNNKNFEYIGFLENKLLGRYVMVTLI